MFVLALIPYAPTEGDSAPLEAIDEPEPILIRTDGDSSLYRLDLEDGAPFYFIETARDGGYAYRIVATVSVVSDIEAVF